MEDIVWTILSVTCWLKTIPPNPPVWEAVGRVLTVLPVGRKGGQNERGDCDGAEKDPLDMDASRE